jgi:hypothetical protein
MSEHQSREEWLHDIEERQRNIVFPDTLNNETRGWRNLIGSKQPPTLIQQLGLLVLAVSFVSFALALFLMLLVGDGFSIAALLQFALICALTIGFLAGIVGAIRLGLAWDRMHGTRRNQRK